MNLERKIIKILVFTLILNLTMVTAVMAKLPKTTNSPPTPQTQPGVKPIFSSSFIQYWYAQDWDLNRWTQELSMLHNTGINEIILQDIADTKAMYAAYPTQIPGYTFNDVDMVGNALTAADSLNMKVRIGLGFNGDWWKVNASNMNWLNVEASKNKLIVDEIVDVYGTHPSLGGWYIPYEFSQLSARSTICQINLNNFYKQIAAEIHLKSTLNIMIAPFYNSKYSYLVSLSGWTKMLKNILNGTGIHIVALQDSVGAGYNTLPQAKYLFKYTKTATDAMGMTLYADNETYTSRSSGNVTATQSDIQGRISAAAPYVQGFIAFSIDHYQNKNETSQVSNYNDYYNYYLTYK